MATALRGKRKAGRPTRRESARLTELIVQKASRSFADNGFAGTTIEKLMEECGVTRRSIIQRFGGKDNLLIEVCRRDTEAYAAGVALMPLRRETAEADFRAICERLWARGLDGDEAALLRTYLGEVARLPEVARLILAFYHNLADVVEQKVELAKDYGFFHEFEAAAVADCAISVLISTPRVRRMVYDEALGRSDSASRHFDNTWAMLRKMM